MQQLLIALENIIGNAHSDALEEILKRYDITKKFEQTEPSNHKLIHLFLSAKRIEGKSEKTLHYYYQTITRTISTINKRVKMITTDDLRQYLSEFQQSRNSSNVTIDNMRRILSSFFRGSKMRIISSNPQFAVFTKSKQLELLKKPLQTKIWNTCAIDRETYAILLF